METFASDIETFASDIETFASHIETFASDIETFASDIEIFASGMETLASDIETFASDIETFASGMETFVSGYPYVCILRLNVWIWRTYICISKPVLDIEMKGLGWSKSISFVIRPVYACIYGHDLNFVETSGAWFESLSVQSPFSIAWSNMFYLIGDTVML